MTNLQVIRKTDAQQFGTSHPFPEFLRLAIFQYSEGVMPTCLLNCWVKVTRFPKPANLAIYSKV